MGCGTEIVVRADRSLSHLILRGRLGSEIDVMDWRIRMNAENLILKRSLVLQSFAPLFILLTIKHIKLDTFWHLMVSFIKLFSDKGLVAVSIAVKNENFGSFVIFIISLMWLLATFIIAIGFRGMQKSGFKSAGEQILIEDSPNDSGATFLVTYVLPLLTDDVSSIRGLIVFLVLLLMVIALLINSNTFYQNPVLSAMKYRTFTFKFVNPASDINHSNRVYVGITHGVPIVEDAVIKRKYISDGFFLIYND